MKTQAAVLWEVGAPWSIEEIELDPPGPGEVLVKLAASGMCHSDEHVVTGDLPFELPIIGGHEGAVGSLRDRVVSLDAHRAGGSEDDVAVQRIHLEALGEQVVTRCTEVVGRRDDLGATVEREPANVAPRPVPPLPFSVQSSARR